MKSTVASVKVHSSIYSWHNLISNITIVRATIPSLKLRQLDDKTQTIIIIKTQKLPSIDHTCSGASPGRFLDGVASWVNHTDRTPNQINRNKLIWIQIHIEVTRSNYQTYFAIFQFRPQVGRIPLRTPSIYQYFHLKILIRGVSLLTLCGPINTEQPKKRYMPARISSEYIVIHSMKSIINVGIFGASFMNMYIYSIQSISVMIGPG